uniref:Uncharacterized protein n=1 Tax=Wuchereria bancrofti TaxID=6293 RepID=A0A1I8EXP5_WUCBA
MNEFMRKQIKIDKQNGINDSGMDKTRKEIAAIGKKKKEKEERKKEVRRYRSASSTSSDIGNTYSLSVKNKKKKKKFFFRIIFGTVARSYSLFADRPNEKKEIFSIDRKREILN